MHSFSLSATHLWCVIAMTTSSLSNCCRAGRSGTAGRSGGNARNTSSNSRWNSNGVPLCPNHSLECLSLTANTPANPGRRFFKCSHQTEADSCLKFVWADEYDGGTTGEENWGVCMTSLAGL